MSSAAEERTSISNSYWQGRNVLVTGATGLLGGWLAPALIGRGAKVTALARHEAPHSLLARGGWLPRISSVFGSVCDRDLIRGLLAERSFETIFHLGGQPLVDVARKDPVSTLETNVRGCWILLDAAREAGVGQIVMASSEKAYGAGSRMPYREDAPLQGRYPYGVSKSCADLIAGMYAHTYGVRVAIARCVNLFGGGDRNFSRLIPGVIQATLRSQSFQIRGDGKSIRDFLYVEDAVEAYLTLAEHLAEDASLAGEAFNFCQGLHMTMLDLTEKILALMGRPELRPVVQNIGKPDHLSQGLDASKAHQRLGWEARIGLEEGLRRTIAWYRQHMQEAVAVAPVGA
ncbi:MAG TPA: NAD-dependent epimerase/dehydratase family protein [Bryobacteraceae bacterium]|nr:NAD-dependent epimerase/dehydratase family protein [Bryobacteraceae bacterium]